MRLVLTLILSFLATFSMQSFAQTSGPAPSTSVPGDSTPESVEWEVVVVPTDGGVARPRTPLRVPETDTQLIINDYELAVVPPSGWCLDTRNYLTLWESWPAPRASINLNWYLPMNARSYRDFDSRIAKENRARFEEDGFQASRLKVENLEAAQFRYVSFGMIVVETLLGVPDENGGELFVLLFTAQDSDSGRKYIEDYDAMIQSMRVSHRMSR